MNSSLECLPGGVFCPSAPVASRVSPCVGCLALLRLEAHDRAQARSHDKGDALILGNQHLFFAPSPPPHPSFPLHTFPPHLPAAAYACVLQGRPKGENKEEDKKKFSLAPVATRLQERLGKKVRSVCLSFGCGARAGVRRQRQGISLTSSLPWHTLSSSCARLPHCVTPSTPPPRRLCSWMTALASP